MSINKDAWSALSMKERAEFFKMMVQNGITDRKTIIDKFNSFEPGGEIETLKLPGNNIYKKLAYVFGTDEAISQKGGASIEDIKRVLLPLIKGENPNLYIDDNKFMYIFGNMMGLPPADNSNGKDFSNYLKKTYPIKYWLGKIKEYQGALNPFDEYIADSRDKGLFEELAKKGKDLYSNADTEYSYMADMYDPENYPYKYRDDVASYNMQFVNTPNGVAVSASDLYDFGPDYHVSKYSEVPLGERALMAAETALMTAAGNPFILRQDNIPVRFVDTVDENGNLIYNEDSYRAWGLREGIDKELLSIKDINEGKTPEQKIAEILETGYIEPSVVIAESKKASGGRILEGTATEQTLSGEPIYYDDTYIEPAVVKAFKSDEEYNRYYGEQFGKKVAEGMNNAAPYVLEAAMLPFTISGALETPMLLYQGAKALPQLVKLGKSAFRKGKKYFGKKVLGMVDDMNGYVKEGSHFRIVDKPAIDDAISSGTIRSKTGLYHGVPEYLRKNFSKYLDDIPGWESMDANELKELLDAKGAFNGMTEAEKKIAKFKIGNSTNHGGTVGYFKDTPYPNYDISTSNYVIETPESVGSFVPGHGGEEFVGYRGPVGASLLKTNGSVKGASIPSKGSSYWEYSPFWEMWKSNKFGEGGDTTNSEKLIWERAYKDLPEGFKQSVLKVARELNYEDKDVEEAYNSGELKAALDALFKHAPYARVRSNDSPTSEESSKWEDRMNSLVYNKPDKRVSPNMKFAIPYIEDLEIKIPGVGRTTTNALDSLAKYAFEAKIPLEEALGLGAQETSLGALPFYNYAEIPKNGTEEEKQKVRDYNRALGNSSYFRNYGIIPAENLVRDFRYNIVEDPISRDVPPLLHAFNYWKEGMYNRGDKNHTSDVIERGKEVMSTKPIQEWIKNSKYAQKVINLFK